MSLQTPPATPVTGLLRNAVCVGKFNKLFSIAKRKLKNIGKLILFPEFSEINHYICPYETEKYIPEYNNDDAEGTAVSCA